jgi:hypothetical protein
MERERAAKLHDTWRAALFTAKEKRNVDASSHPLF